MCVYGLMVVVGVLVYRSAQIVGGPSYSWDHVAAFKPSLSFLTALPLIIFAFQASRPPMRGVALLSGTAVVLCCWHCCVPLLLPPLSLPCAVRVCSCQSMCCLRCALTSLQCHTNVISVWDELEHQPAFFSSSSKPAGEEAAVNTGQAVEQQQERRRQQQQQQQQQWGQRQPKSDKLAGMIRVVCLANLATALFYSCVGA